MIHIAPSILAADFSKLGEQVAEAESAGVGRVHVDVMDGHFVPNLSMGPAVVRSLRPHTRLRLEVHLMVQRPADYVESFLLAGADSLIVHHEVLANPVPLLHAVRARGHKVGMCVNPDTPVEVLEPYLADIDVALCMTVHPGFGGQCFLLDSIERIGRLRRLIDKLNPACELEVDGGINADTASMALDAGANVLVSGTGIFHHPNGIAAAIEQLDSIARSVQ